MRKATLLGAILGVLTFAGAANSAADTEIRVIADGPWDRNEAIWNLFRTEMESLLGTEFGVSFDEASLVEADWTVAGVRDALDRALSDRDVDAVVGLGVLASQELCRRGDLAKPAVAPFILDPEVQGVPLDAGRSGVRNLAYVTSVGRVRKDLDTFRRAVPFERMAFLATSTFLEAIPGLADRTRAQSADAGIDASVHAIGSSAAEALAAIPQDAEAVFVAPLLRLPEAEFDALVAGLIERKLPSFSLFGHSEVRRGLLVGTTPDTELGRRARRTALNLQRMLLGENGADIPVHFSENERLALNLATARAIGVRPTWSVITEAELIDRERLDPGRRLGFRQAIEEALVVNRDVVAADAAVAASAAEIAEARGVLLPQVQASALGTILDPDVVESSFGQAERTLSGALTVSQVLLSDGAWAGLSIEKRLHLVEEMSRETLILDVAEATATAYLTILRAEAGERIQRENLERTEANLELARVRQRVGYSSPGEVYRWEGEIATRRADLIAANAQRNIAELEMNRLLHRPLEDSFTLDSNQMLDGEAGIGDPRLRGFLDDPWSFRVLRSFLEEEAVRKSPEIQALDAGIEAQNRALTAVGREFWIPTIGAEGELSHVFGRYGDGAELDPGSPFAMRAPDTTWQIGIRASLPLFEGGSRLARRRGARETLYGLEREREASVERIQLRIRAAMHAAGASYAGIDLSEQAAQAARRNLDLVRDAYSQGAVSVLDLLDAQNSALTADDRAATALYDFLLDLTTVQRALGSFFCTYSVDEYEDFITRLQAYRDRSEDS